MSELKTLLENWTSEARNTLSEKLDGLIPESEKETFMKHMEFIVELRVRELAGQDVGLATDIIKGTIKQWEATENLNSAIAIKETAKEVLGLGGTFVGGILKSLIK